MYVSDETRRESDGHREGGEELATQATDQETVSTMTDHRLLELIHGEIDGTNSEAQAEELRRRVERDREAAVLRDAMRRVAEVLREAGAVEPPAILRPAILRAVEPGMKREDVSKRAGGWQRFLIAWLPARASGWSYACVLGVGILTGVAAHELVAGRTTAIQPSDLVGTMTGRPAVFESVDPQRIEIDGASVGGSVTTHTSDGCVTIELDLDAHDTVEVLVAYEAGRLAFRGFDQQSGEVDGLHADGAGIRWTQAGPQRVALSLAARDASPSVVDIEFHVAGHLAHSERIEVPGPR